MPMDNSGKNSPKPNRMRGPGGHGPGGMGMPGEKAKNFKGTMKKLLSYIGAYKIAVIFVILFSIGSTIFAIVGPKILGKATTEIFVGVASKYQGGAGINFGRIAEILIFLLILYGISSVLSLLQGIIMTGLECPDI